MIKRKVFFMLFILLSVFVFDARAAYQSRFDAVNFEPAVDDSNYFTVYGSRTLTAWQGHAGFYFDYANRPLEFRATAGAVGRQSVLDHTIIFDALGSIGITDWFEVGVNMPVALYNWYYTDDVNAAADFGSSMGDMLIMTKFRFVDIDKYHVGLSLVPYVSLPTGDVVRYTGSGHVMGGARLVFDAKFHERFEMSLNAGYLMHDDVQRTFNFANGSTSTIRVDDWVDFGVGMNVKASRYFQLIAEAYGNTQILHGGVFTTNTTSLEAGAGMRYFFGDSGFALGWGGTAGLIEGVGTPRFRGYVGLTWTAPETQACPPCAPDPRIKDNKIVIWGKIFFDTAKATIKPVSYPVLDDVVDVLRTHPEIRLVEVQGHCDWRGSDSYNLGLSQRRTESVRQYLINAGIDGNRLRAVGYGESQPIASNDTVEGMSQNRRVEFVIIESSAGYTTTPNSSDSSRNTYAPIHEIRNGVTVGATPQAVSQVQAPEASPVAVIPEPVRPLYPSQVVNQERATAVPRTAKIQLGVPMPVVPIMQPEVASPSQDVVTTPQMQQTGLERVGSAKQVEDPNDTFLDQEVIEETTLPENDTETNPDLVPESVPAPSQN